MAKRLLLFKTTFYLGKNIVKHIFKTTFLTYFKEIRSLQGTVHRGLTLELHRSQFGTADRWLDDTLLKKNTWKFAYNPGKVIVKSWNFVTA